MQAAVFVSCGELYIGRCPPGPGCRGPSAPTAGPPSPSSHTSTRKTTRRSGPDSRVPALGPRRREALRRPRLGPALAEGHLVEPSTPWLPPTLDRGHWQLDLTQGAPPLPHPPRPEPHPAHRALRPESRTGQLMLSGAGWRPLALPLAPPHPDPMPSPCCKLLLGFRVLAPTPNTLAAESPHLRPGHALAFRVPPAQCLRPLHLCGSHGGPGSLEAVRRVSGLSPTLSLWTSWASGICQSPAPAGVTVDRAARAGRWATSALSGRSPARLWL